LGEVAGDMSLAQPCVSLTSNSCLASGCFSRRSVSARMGATLMSLPANECNAVR